MAGRWGRSVFGNERMLLIMFESESQVTLMRWVMALDLAALIPSLILTPLKTPWRQPSGCTDLSHTG